MFVIDIFPMLLSFLNIFNRLSLVHAISGGLGSALALTICFPLDTVRTRLQVDTRRKAHYSHRIIKDIIYEEGTLSLYRGWFSAVISLFTTNFVYFLFFHGCRTAVSQLKVENASISDGKVIVDLVIGIAAGCTTVMVTNPLWVVNTRLKLQGAKFNSSIDSNRNRPSNGIIDCIRQVIIYEGVGALWAGVGTSLILVANPAIQFVVYETIKRNLSPFFNSQNFGGIIYFLYGAIAKLVSTISTYPMQVFQTRSQAGLKTNKADFSISIIAIVKNYYRGLESKLLQTVLTASLMFFLYEHIVNNIKVFIM